MIDFWVAGTPAPGGSKTAIPIRDRVGNIVCRWVFSKRYGRKIPFPALKYVDSGGTKGKSVGKGNVAWRETVAVAARRAYTNAPIGGDQPIRVLFAFVLARPQDHHEGGDRGRPLRTRFLDRLWPTTKPDALKLARSTEDALTGILWADDSQNVQIYIEKRYAGPGERTGCRIKVTAPIATHFPDATLLFAHAQGRD